MTLRLAPSIYYSRECHWIVGVVLRDFLGVDYVIEQPAGTGFSLMMDDKQLVLSDEFFRQADESWLHPKSLPSLPLSALDVAASGLDAPLAHSPLPVLFGRAEIVIAEDRLELGLDIFGSAFFMLSRYEEAVSLDRDSHDRFPATASVACQADILDRPIVDEYIEVLWAAMKRLWPRMERKSDSPRKFISCDVDNPYVCGARSLNRAARHIGKNLLKQQSPTLALNSVSNFLRQRTGNYSQDPYLRAIDWMMDVNEKAGNRVAFYFITEHSHPTFDGCYDMNEPVIRHLIRRIAARGHEIGLHGSYNTYRDADQFRREANTLRRVLAEEGIEQNQIGGRQHVLRWQTPTTAVIWDAAGMNYDSTLSYADRSGFRCGTCREYSMYDLAGRQPLNLRQRPLVVMESTVIAARYMNLGYSDKALSTMLSYKNTCRAFKGDFTLLWHNSHFENEDDKRFYEILIQ